MRIRTRFAPSPTGSLHVGSVRTALFSWLFARRHQGQFVLRIEDTDQQRSTQESVDVILQGMEWMGLQADEGPVYQTQRYERYAEVARRLLDEGKAYRCECSKERLEKLRAGQLAAKEKPRYDGHCRDKALGETDKPSVIRFRNPLEGEVFFIDKVYGEIRVSNQELDDLVMVRSDGHPTYNFAVVVDDWDMEISHVIRGDDHISNTPRQINIFQALGAPVPVFAHLPMILGEDGKRLSKRHGAVSVLEFKKMGVLPQALLNYLARLGWSHGDQEIFSIADMMTLFDLSHVSRGVASFNYEKLFWLNQHYQRTEPAQEVADRLRWHFEQAGVDYHKGPSLTELVSIQAERCKTLAEMLEKSHYFYQERIEYDEAAVKKHLRPVVYEPLQLIHQKLAALPTWDKDNVQAVINDVCAVFALAMAKIAQPLRVAVTGTSMSPSIDHTLLMIGKERCLSRLQEALERIAQRKESAQ
ncbi:MAG: glutamate--tRNA ligase [Legionellaceae bacterium]|nr:glutamate--tRNA ligase [Legionellaceae bacterium]